MELLEKIAARLQDGADAECAELTRQAIGEGASAASLLNDALIAGMDVVGERFRKHEIFLPHVMLAARAMKAALEVLEPHLLEEDVPKLGKVVIGSVRGDLHDIGKNLVGIMLQGAGFEIIDLGADVTPDRFVDTAASAGAAVIGMSALLTTTMGAMKEVVELVRDRGLEDVKTIVGGAPVSAEYAREIGADGYGFDAANAVVRVKELAGA